MGRKHHASVRWEGDFGAGRGAFGTPRSQRFDPQLASCTTRVAEHRGRDPEALPAAVHAGGFSTARCFGMHSAGITTACIDTRADLDLKIAAASTVAAAAKCDGVVARALALPVSLDADLA